MEFDLAVRRRGMVRAFRPDPVDPRTLRRMLGHAWRAPSAGLTQPLEASVREVLRLPDHILPVGLIPVGYPAERPPRYRRRPRASQVHLNGW